MAAGRQDEAWLYVDDPILPPKQAAAYLGRAARTLRKLAIPRVPMVGEGHAWGYRRSTLNRVMRELEDADSRIPTAADIVRTPRT